MTLSPIRATLVRLLPLGLPAVCLAAVVLAASPGSADSDRDGFLAERPGIGEPLRFRDEHGGAFRPRALIVAGPGGAMAAQLPETARETLSENRLDLSGTPLVGPLFRGTLDVATARQGALVGPVYRVGDALVIEAVQMPPELARRHVAFATNLPRYGAVSYRLGRLDWTPVTKPTAPRTELGTAHLLDGVLVLASRGGEPAWPSLEALFRDLF